jgi:hypothetical protein
MVTRMAQPQQRRSVVKLTNTIDELAKVGNKWGRIGRCLRAALNSSCNERRYSYDRRQKKPERATLDQ